MGRPRNEDKKKVDDGIKDAKKLMEDAQAQNGCSIIDVLGVLGDGYVPSTIEQDEPVHIPINALKQIQEKLGEKVKRVDDVGNITFEPLHNEEEKAKMIFALLAERGINLLDHLENCLAQAGYHDKVVTSINDTMGKVAEMLRDIGEIQYRKAKLDNERTHLEIQKYKADLKKREIDIKEKIAETGPSNTNVIAVGSANDILEIINGSKGIENIQEAHVIGDDDGEETE